MGNRLVIRLGRNGLVAASMFLVALSGYTATKVIEQSAPPVMPLSPYASKEPADCSTPELEPVRCPNGGGDGCPDAAPSPSDSATSALLRRPGGGETHTTPAPDNPVHDSEFRAEAMATPTGTYPLPIGEARLVVCVKTTYLD